MGRCRWGLGQGAAGGRGLCHLTSYSARYRLKQHFPPPSEEYAGAFSAQPASPRWPSLFLLHALISPVAPCSQAPMFPALPALGEDDDGADWQEAGEADGGPAAAPAAIITAPPSAAPGVTVRGAAEVPEPDHMSPRDQATTGPAGGAAPSKTRAIVPPLPTLSLLVRTSIPNNPAAANAAAATAAMAAAAAAPKFQQGGGGDDAAVRDSKMQRWRDELLAELESKRQEHRASVAGSMAAGRG